MSVVGSFRSREVGWGGAALPPPSEEGPGMEGGGVHEVVLENFKSYEGRVKSNY